MKVKVVMDVTMEKFMKKANNLKAFKKNQLIKIIRSLEKAIKLNCYDCQGGQKRLDCKLRGCSLYPFRPWAKSQK